MRTPSPFVSTTEGSPQDGKIPPFQHNVNRTFDEMKLKDAKSPEIVIEEDVPSPEAGDVGGESFGKAESSMSSISVSCSPCLSVSHYQVQSCPVLLHVHFRRR